jgi:hypothetical protein
MSSNGKEPAGVTPHDLRSWLDSPATVEQVLAEAAELGITEEELEREAATLNRPGGWLPGIGPVSGLVMDMLGGSTLFREPGCGAKCYPLASGNMVHVKPDCRR